MPARLIPLSRITVAARLRAVDAAWVEALAASLAQQGLNQAIVVRKLPIATEDDPRFALVAGAHRFAAAQTLGWDTIEADVQDLTELQARLVEIDENLMRRELGALDRGLFLSERQRVWVQMHPETAKGGDRRSKDAQTKATRCRLGFPETFTKEAAARTGLSQRTIQRAIDLVAGLSLATITMIRNTSLADNASELKRLAAERPEDQVHLAGILAEGAARTVRGARILAEMESPAERDPEEQRYARIIDLLTRATPRTRRRVIEHLRLKGWIETPEGEEAVQRPRERLPRVSEVLRDAGPVLDAAE